MKAVLQRVSSASVTVDHHVIASINKGILVLLGIHKDDTADDADYIIQKLINLRFFDNASGLPDLSVLDISGDILVVSQFTLYGSTRKGRRPSFTDAARPDDARQLYQYFCERLKGSYPKVAFGEFGATMSVQLVNEGPFTLEICS